MATVAMIVGGAVVNALAFSGSNYLFSKMDKSRHEEAMTKLAAAKNEWEKRRTQRLDFLNEQLKRQNHSMKTFADVNQAMHEYSIVFGKTMSPLPEEPTLAEFYAPSQDGEIIFTILGMCAVVAVAFKLKA